MDGSNSRAGANNETNGSWRSAMFHAMVAWEIAYAISVTSPGNTIYDARAVMSWVQTSQRSVYTSAQNKEEYNSNMAKWITSIDALSQIPGRRPLPTSGGNERDAILYWHRLLRHKVEQLIRGFSSQFPNWCRLAFLLLEQIDSAPQHLMMAHVVKCNLIIKILEKIILYLNMTRSQISPSSRDKLNRLERVIVLILCRRRNLRLRHRQERFSSALDPSSELSPAMNQQNPNSPDQIPHPNVAIRKRNLDDGSEQEEPKKTMKQEPMEFNISEKRETPAESSKYHDDDDGGEDDDDDVSLKI